MRDTTASIQPHPTNDALLIVATVGPHSDALKIAAYLSAAHDLSAIVETFPCTGDWSHVVVRRSKAFAAARLADAFMAGMFAGRCQ